jgi:hypothetical protein
VHFLEPCCLFCAGLTNSINDLAGQALSHEEWLAFSHFSSGRGGEGVRGLGKRWPAEGSREVKTPGFAFTWLHLLLKAKDDERGLRL